MKREILQLYKEGAPGLTETEEGHFRGVCPFCREEDSFLVGLRSAITGEPTNDFLCLECDREGSPEEFVKALGKLHGTDEDEDPRGVFNLSGNEKERREPHQVESGMSQFETVGQSGFGGFSRSDGEGAAEIGGEELEPEARGPEVASELKALEQIWPLLTLDLPGRELQTLLLLQLRRNGISAKEIGEELQIPQSNVHRYLSGLEEKRLIFSEGKPKRYFKIDDARLMGRFRRRLQRQI